MPCDQVLLNTVEFSDATDLDVLEEAFRAAGYSVYRLGNRITFSHPQKFGTGYFQNGSMTVPESFGDMKEIKVQYSVASVKKSAAKMGWKVKVNPKNPLKMQLVKGY